MKNKNNTKLLADVKKKLESAINSCIEAKCRQ